VDAQTSIQTQTSAQVITSIQTETSAQVVTSVQVQTSVQTSIMVITSVAVQTSISVQSQAPPISIPSSAISQLPATISSSSQEPSTSFLQSSSSMILPLSTSPLISSLMQHSTSILSTSTTPTFSTTAASIVQSLTSLSPQSVPTSTTTPVPKVPDQTTDSVSASLTSAIIAGAISAANNPTTTPGISTASIVSGSVVGAIILTGLVVAGVIFFKRRAQKRASAQFEASLGRTNFADEKNSVRGSKGWNGDNGFALFRFGNSGSNRGISPPLVNRNGGPVDTRAGTTQVMDQAMAPVQMYGARNTYQRTSGGRFSIFSRSTAAPYWTESYMSEQGIPRRLTGDGGSSFRSSAALVNPPNRVVIPERGLEKRVSGGTLEAIERAENAQRPGYPNLGTTFRSETFDKLLYDVQSQPF
jgi:hypothetical protein